MSPKSFMQRNMMMRSVMFTAAAFAMLAACSPAGGGAGNEDELATKIVDAQGVLDLGDETLSQVVGAQLQSIAMQNPGITPEQGAKLEAEIRKNIEAELPALKKDMAGFLAEAFDAKELQTYFDYVGSTEGDTVKKGMPQVMQKSLAAADAMTTKAVDKAVADVVGAAPVAPADGATPEDPAKPTNPQ
jgi:hypothetical protein